MTTTECDLVIVGAGPVGLATALFARSIGLEPVVVDARDELGPGVGSRALFVHRDSLMLLDAAAPGLGREIGEFGLVWERRRTLYSGHTVYDRPERHRNEHPRSYTCLRQADTERFLRTRYAAGGATVRWGTRVTAVEPRSRVATALEPTGSFVFSFLHPCFFGRRPVEDPVTGMWSRHVNGYLAHEQRNVQSFGGHTHYHRPLSWYATSLADHGLAITGLDEPRTLPSHNRPESEWSDYERWFATIPTMIAVACHRLPR